MAGDSTLVSALVPAQSLRDRQSIKLAFPPPLGLYIHMPWCEKKCPYCDFNSHAFKDLGARHTAGLSLMKAEVDRQQTVDEQMSAQRMNGDMQHDRLYQTYVDALIRDIECSLASVWGRTVQTVFIGGGTPSLCPPREMARLLDALRSLLRLAADAEITMEANPGSVERARFEAFADAGIHRLSLGVQSFSDAQLNRIGRVHGGAEAIAAVDTALSVFPRVNIDLMYGQPAQTLSSLEQDLDIVLDRSGSALGHLSLYQFTLEPNTWFAKHPPADMPDEETIEAMQNRIALRLSQSGFEQYEVSAWSLPGQRCRHNLNYWQFGDYLGVGAGAHGKLSDHRGIRRTIRRREPEAYIASVLGADTLAKPAERWLESDDLPFEFMLNALRLKDGVPSHWWQERCGLPAEMMLKYTNLAFSKGLLDPDPAVFRASALGWRFLNDLQALFLADAPKRC
ncbi:MAG: radical SAM family heme chaperone HemW [Betaproteobacteria bacterium]|nr:radical SAM family heme chaperone HemW [Betaproteobacteria bacterium]